MGLLHINLAFTIPLSSILIRLLHEILLTCLYVFILCVCINIFYHLMNCDSHSSYVAVDRYLKRWPVLDSGSSQPNPLRTPPEDLVFPSDSDASDASEMLHTPYPLAKQSSLPLDVERDSRTMRMSSMLPRQLSADGTYRGWPKSQTAGSTEHIDSDSSLSSSDRDGVPLKSGSGSKGIHHKVHSRHKPNVLSMLTASEASKL